jgi:hypothetical protein
MLKDGFWCEGKFWIFWSCTFRANPIEIQDSRFKIQEFKIFELKIQNSTIGIHASIFKRSFRDSKLQKLYTDAASRIVRQSEIRFNIGSHSRLTAVMQVFLYAREVARLLMSNL